MTDSEDSNNNKLDRFYHEGYLKGYDDAIIGIRMKLLEHTFLLSSTSMQYWEEGYKKGYADALHDKAPK